MELSRKSVLITGSSKGLGAELALVFAQNSYDVILHGRNLADLNGVREQVLELGVHCCMVVGDLRFEETLETLVKRAMEWGVSVLLNNAGVDVEKLPLSETDDEQIDEMVATNLIAPIKLSKRLYPCTIININSLSGLNAHKNKSVYCASKWGLQGFTKCLRLEGVRVIGVYPSRMMTKGFTYGLDPREVAQKIYRAYTSNIDEVILEGEAVLVR